MNNNRITCDPKRIELFLQQKLSDEEQTAFELHLDDCHDCRRQLEATAASDDIWSGVRDSLLGQQLPPDGLRSGGSTLDFTTGGDASFSHTTVLKLLAPTDDDRMLGRLGTYEVMGVIGSGGMGVVLKAFDAALNRNVAIKVLAPHLGSSGAARKRFSREAQAAAAVVHDNVMEIYGVADVDGLPYLVMPYVRGPSLQRRLDDDGPLALVEILRIGMQAAAGLAAAHAQGLVHRDVKPANILLADGVERVKLTDFGLARAADDASLTKTGIIAGTPQYMSPEQSRGESVDQRSDLFSLGSVLYAMCTGRAPFRAETSYGVLRRVTDEEPRPIREINPDIPEWLCRIIATLMSKQPDDRFASARKVAELLEECLAHVQQPTAVPLPASLVPLSMSSRFLSISHRSLGVIAMIATFALGLAGFIFWQPAQAPDTPGSRSTPGSVAAEPAPLVFGPAIERVIAMPDADDQGMVFFDLETGKSFKPPFPLMFYPKTGPAFVELTPELVQWIKARDVDLLCHLVEKNWDIMTLGMQENYAGELKEWETLSPDEVVRMLAEMDAEPPVRDEDPSSSFGHSSQDGIAYFTAFMTRSNTMGVYRLEDVDMSRSTSLGVRIRYKLVQGVIPDESKPTVAQLTELGARRIAKGARGTWSPDGKRIALGKMPFGSGIAVVEVTGVASDSPSPTSGTRPTFVLDAEIGSVRDLVVDGKDPAFSPDGKRVAFTREVAEGPPKEEIWLGAVDELMKDKTSMRRLGAGVMATWSADASTVFFSNPQTREIFSVRTDQPDAEPAVMWKAVGDLFPDLWYPVVAPDGRRVAYHADGQLKIADMTSQTIVGSWPLDGWHGFLGGWSPDGSQLGYGAFGGEDKGLWLLRFPMAVEGNLFHYGKPIVPKPTRLLDGSCTSPSWSPDGSKLAFDFRSPERGYEVWMVDAKAIDNLLGIIITGQADEIITGQADERAESMNHLKQIGLAVHIYHDAYGTFPPAYRAENSGRPLLSWRVLILPYLGQEALYRQFHLDEPWDSEHNRKLSETVVPAYRSPGSKTTPAMTNYLTVRGPNTVFPGKDALSYQDVIDGLANAIMVVEASDQKAVVWTKPDDFEYDESDPLAGLIGLRSAGFLATLCDGSVQLIPSSVEKEALRCLFLRNDGKPIPSPIGKAD